MALSHLMPRYSAMDKYKESFYSDVKQKIYKDAMREFKIKWSFVNDVKRFLKKIE